MPYTIDASDCALRSTVEDRLYGLDRLSPHSRGRVVTAWTSSIASSAYETIDDAPFSAGHHFYPLIRHINEVTRTGIDLGRRAEADWKVHLDWDEMISILILHDLDKPLLTEPVSGTEHRHTALFKELPHGVVGAMMLKEMGFSNLVVSTVATHATNAPFHGETIEAQILHYADLFAADFAMRAIKMKPFYQYGIAGL